MCRDSIRILKCEVFNAILQFVMLNRVSIIPSKNHFRGILFLWDSWYGITEFRKNFEPRRNTKLRGRRITEYRITNYGMSRNPNSVTLFRTMPAKFSKTEFHGTLPPKWFKYSNHPCYFPIVKVSGNSFII